MALQKPLVYTLDTLNRRGAEEARGAHNSEVIRSKRIAGIITLRPFTEAVLVYTRHFQPAWRSGSARGS